MDFSILQHKTKSNHHYHQFTKASGKTKKEVIKIKREITQGQLPTAKWDKTPVENYCEFKCLGSIFTPDDNHMEDVCRHRHVHILDLVSLRYQISNP